MKEKKPFSARFPRLALHLPGVLALLSLSLAFLCLSAAARPGTGRTARGFSLLGAILAFSLSVFFFLRWLRALRRAWREGTFLSALRRGLRRLAERLSAYRERRSSRRAALSLRGVRTESFRLTAEERGKKKKRRSSRRPPETDGEHIRLYYARTVSRSARAGVPVPRSRTPRELAGTLAHTPERRELFSLYETVRYAEREPALGRNGLARLREAAEDVYTGRQKQQKDRPDAGREPKGTL